MSTDDNQGTFKTDDRPVKPVLIVSQQTLRDYSICLRHLLVGLADESVPVGLICPAENDIESLVPLGIEVIKHPAYELPLLWLANQRTLIEKLYKFGPTVLHCLCRSKAAFTRRLSRKLHLPYILTINSLSKRITGLQISNSRCVKIIVPTKSIAASITGKNPKLADCVKQINIGTFVEDRTCCFDEKREIANMVTSFHGERPQNFSRFLEAIRHLALDGYKFMLVIISEGRAERKLRKILTDPLFAEIVIVIPRLEPWRSVLTAADIYIRATSSDRFEPVLVEAMSVGNAIAACKGGADDLILEQKTAAIFNEGDQASIYETLRGLIADRQTTRILAKSAQEYLRQNHTVSATVSATVEVYRQAQQMVLKNVII